MSVIAFGSINMDLVVRTARLPRPGESFTGHSFFTAGGGKGANQAVACARMGVPTRLIGRVGGDDFGTTLRRDLQGYGVDISGVAVQPGDAAAMAAAIASLAADRHRRGRMGEAGGSFVAREFSRALWAARYLSLLSRLPAAGEAGQPVTSVVHGRNLT